MTNLQNGLSQYLSPIQRKQLASVTVGIAGLGGLGSNCAVLLARSGIENFILIDGDILENSNLNRQYYLPKHIGLSKVDALSDILQELNPAINITKYKLWLTEQNTAEILQTCPLWVEGLDEAITKRFFVETALNNVDFVVSASGIAGYGGQTMQQRKLGKKLVLVGDFSNDVNEYPPLAPRVMQAAAMQADALLTYIFEN